jgi:glycosyltransferase involved in cell wall biosynthesis
MINLMHLVQSLNVGGLEKMALSLAHSSQFASSTVIVVLEGTFEQIAPLWPKELTQTKFIFLNKKPGFSYQVVKTISDIIREHEIQVVHSHHIGPLLYASLATTGRGVKHISTVHDAWYLNSSKWRMYTQLIASVSGTYFVADANKIALDFAAKVRTSRLGAINNGVDCDYFVPKNRAESRELLNLPQNATLIGCAARVEKGKGHKRLIQYIASAPVTHYLVFAGTGSLQASLKNYAQKLGVSNRVIWLGNVTNMVDFYNAINVKVLFSSREGLPLTVLEAFSCGTPVVGSNVGAMPDWISEPVGAVVPLDHPERLASAISHAINRCKRDDIRAFAIKHGSLSEMAKRYDMAYQSVLKGELCC